MLNWKNVGVSLTAWGVIGLGSAAGMAVIPAKSVSSYEQASWAWECFNGNFSSCRKQGEQKAHVEMWRQRAWIAGAIGVVLLVAGVSVQSGAGRQEGETI